MADLTPARERALLFEHGTKPWRLPPSAVLGAARNDLRKRETRGPRRYVFLRTHVKPAKSPADLLRRAFHDRESGLATSRVETLILYSDEETLKQAWLLAVNFEAGAK